MGMSASSPSWTNCFLPLPVSLLVLKITGIIVCLSCFMLTALALLAIYQWRMLHKRWAQVGFLHQKLARGCSLASICPSLTFIITEILSTGSLGKVMGCLQWGEQTDAWNVSASQWVLNLAWLDEKLLKSSLNNTSHPVSESLANKHLKLNVESLMPKPSLSASSVAVWTG